MALAFVCNCYTNSSKKLEFLRSVSEDKDSVLKAMDLVGWSLLPELLEAASHALRDDKDVVMKALENERSWEFVSDRLKKDKDVKKAAGKSIWLPGFMQ